MAEQTKQFDVTTAEARLQACREAMKYGWIPVFGDVYMLWKLAALYSTESVTKEIESQRKTAIEIVRAGKENNVDELEITMSEKTGLSLGSSVEGFPIECTAGTSGTMTVKVKYK
jgi:hypothetical protein